MFLPPDTAPSEIPVGLQQQFKRHAPRYAVGLLFLAAYQSGQYLFNVTLAKAINASTSANASAALHSGLVLVGLAVSCFVVRILSRMTIFNAGRIAEYELRKALLYRLHRLGPAFYGRMRTGDIMSRVTNDLG
ncbi:MAG TPA: ABC transporter transmembrane domain-containing protein, partial [Polyangiaceae bacterium]|nr:ABC transporter transmembrane domain-containing protein [Polyangiaceae bacterium]